MTRERLMEPEALASSDPAARARLLLVHVGERAGYERAHLPGARLVEPRELVSGQPPAPGGLPDQARLEGVFSALGYTPDRPIVVYDDEGGGWAGRFVWILDVIGHCRWRYLDGGLTAWAAAGLPLAAGAPPAALPGHVSLHLDLSPVADVDDVLAAIGDREQLIWDVRSPAEYRGEKSGSRRAGHIPGAVNLDWMELKDPARALRLVSDLRERMEARGITPDKRIITHCQTHHRSGLSYLAARLLGYPQRARLPGLLGGVGQSRRHPGGVRAASQTARRTAGPGERAVRPAAAPAAPARAVPPGGRLASSRAGWIRHAADPRLRPVLRRRYHGSGAAVAGRLPQLQRLLHPQPGPPGAAGGR